MYDLAWESLNWGYFPELVSFLLLPYHFVLFFNISQCALCRNYFPTVYLPTPYMFTEDRAVYF